MSARLVEPEILDALAGDDPRAAASRRDLKRINAFMLETGHMARALSGLPRPRRLLDLGSGDGLFMLSVAKKLARAWPGVTITLLDRQDIVTHETRARFEGLGWRCEAVAAEIFDYLAQGQPADIVTANLFLHHFEAPALRRLFAAIAQNARALIACEPRRSAFALLGSKLVFVLGANSVSRHDAVASVRAGFTGNELSALWPQGPFLCRERWAPPFTHLFTARHPEPAEGRHDV